MNTPTRDDAGCRRTRPQTHELFGTDAARAYVAQAKRVKQAQEGQGMRTRSKPSGGGVVSFFTSPLKGGRSLAEA